MQIKNRLLREHTHLKIMAALALKGGDSLSWSDALQVSGLSKDAFAKGVADLKTKGLLQETLERSGDKGRLRVMLSLTKESRERVREILGPLREFQRWRELSDRFNSVLLRLVSEKKRKKDIREVLDDHFSGILNSIVGVFLEVALVKEYSDPILQSFISSEAFDTIRRLVWREEFVSYFKTWTKEEMKEDKESNMKQFEKEIIRLERKAKKRGS